MQQKHALDYLMPRVRQLVLAAILLDHKTNWTLADLAKSLSLHHATVQRELATLENAGVVLRRQNGSRPQYAANYECPFLPELRTILVKTIGLVEKVREAIKVFELAIGVSFIYGSIAGGTENSKSDIDLMVVGDVSLLELSERLRPLEHDLGREINPFLYTANELCEKLKGRSHFLTSVMDSDKLFIVGGPNDLARLAEQECT